MWPGFVPFAISVALVSACNTPAADTSPFGTMPTAGSNPTSTDDTSTSAAHDPDSNGPGSGEDSTSTTGLSTGAPGNETASASTTLIWDVGTDRDLGDPTPPGCKGKIDFLFVISRYAGMEYFQTPLVTAFQGFVDTIKDEFADFDYHIMVVDGDPYWGLSTCDEQCPAQCVPGYPCGYTATSCDTTMGAGVVFPAGDGASNTSCKIDGARRYMTKGQTDLPGTFACAAQVGSSGADLIGEALTAAMQPGINGQGGCNSGFLRNDALLMVTLISNTYDSPDPQFGSKGTPGSWANAVRQAKGENLESVVMFSILDTGYEPGCHPHDRTCQMAKLFPYSLVADRDDDYGPAFATATQLVDAACAGFVPPG